MLSYSNKKENCMEFVEELINDADDTDIVIYYLFNLCTNPKLLHYKNKFFHTPSNYFSSLISLNVLDEKDVNKYVMEQFNINYKNNPEQILSIINAEIDSQHQATNNVPKTQTDNNLNFTDIKFSTIENGVLVKFDERDLDENGCYTTPNFITSIGASAFEHCKQLKHLIIAEGVINFNDFAFAACTNLQTIQLPSSLKTLGSATFFACKNLNAIDIPAQVSTLDFLLFCRCVSLKTITLHGQIKKINQNAFYLCNDVTPINLPNRFKEDWNKGAFKQKAPYSVVKLANHILKNQGVKPLDIFR